MYTFCVALIKSGCLYLTSKVSLSDLEAIFCVAMGLSLLLSPHTAATFACPVRWLCYLPRTRLPYFHVVIIFILPLTSVILTTQWLPIIFTLAEVHLSSALQQSVDLSEVLWNLCEDSLCFVKKNAEDCCCFWHSCSLWAVPLDKCKES